jgi:hypothetical protein
LFNNETFSQFTSSRGERRTTTPNTYPSRPNRPNRTIILYKNDTVGRFEERTIGEVVEKWRAIPDETGHYWKETLSLP